MSTTVTIPNPVPAEGYRKLSPQEMARRQRALTCIRSGATAQCQGQVYVTMFFDGTGNSKDYTEPGYSGTQKELWKHSNVARLFDSAIVDTSNGFFPFYIPGVGTPCPDVNDLDGGKIFGKNGGGAAGYMGADRINWGITRVLDAVHAYVTGGAFLFPSATVKTIVKNMSSSVGALSFESSYRRTVLRNWVEKLAAVMKSSQRKVTQINLAVLGFSRGSAEARAFANWFSEIVKQGDGGYELAGVPVRIYFVGLFDTVASVGLANLVPGVNGHMAWADGAMAIPAAVEQCVHFIALHEQRACFPLETAANVKQVVYPGMHTDVGGGYLPTEQGKLAQCSQIPLNDMHFAAIQAGVPLLTIEEIRQHGDLKKAFDVPPDLVRAYNNYWTNCGIGAGGETGKIVQQHTRQYVQWRGGMLIPGQDIKTRGFFQRANRKDLTELLNAENDLVAQVQRLRAASQALTTGAAMPYGDTQVRPIDAVQRSLLAELDKHADLPDAARAFFDDYVHDSRAGFTDIPGSGIEPSDITGGYLRYRNIYRNDRVTTNVASIPLQAVPSAEAGFVTQTAVV
ncbi:DUF2235 domain-containing protein [Paraburkholderia sediminicola]|uniref:T6SS phospholipase effector Tle1-like catalytic domain-containing protein n=1 Tax=Paraburkholderia sediminicola TaxID=458836 RepID=UPI0038BA55C3